MNHILIAIDEADSESMLNGGIIAAFETQEEAISAGQDWMREHADEHGYIVSVVDLAWPQSGTIALQNDHSMTEKYGVGPVGR